MPPSAVPPAPAPAAPGAPPIAEVPAVALPASPPLSLPASPPLLRPALFAEPPDEEPPVFVPEAPLLPPLLSSLESSPLQALTTMPPAASANTNTYLIRCFMIFLSSQSDQLITT